MEKTSLIFWMSMLMGMSSLTQTNEHECSFQDNIFILVQYQFQLTSIRVFFLPIFFREPFRCLDPLYIFIWQASNDPMSENKDKSELRQLDRNRNKLTGCGRVGYGVENNDIIFGSKTYSIDYIKPRPHWTAMIGYINTNCQTNFIF